MRTQCSGVSFFSWLKAIASGLEAIAISSSKEELEVIALCCFVPSSVLAPSSKARSS